MIKVVRQKNGRIPQVRQRMVPISTTTEFASRSVRVESVDFVLKPRGPYVRFHLADDGKTAVLKNQVDNF